MITIVITVYNKQQFLHRVFDSVLNQKGVNDSDYEVLVINDGSTDNSLSIIEDYARQYSYIRVFNQSNQGLSMARNKGVELAVGDYVWFVDADDYISPESVSLICEAAKKNPDVISIYSNTEGENGIIRNSVSPDIKTGKEMLLDPNVGVCGVFNILRKEFVKKNALKYYPGIYHEDSEFTPRMLYYANNVIVIPRVLYTVIHEPNSITQVPRAKRAFDCLIVAEHLISFIEKNNEVNSDIGRVFINNAAVCVNNALNIIIKNNPEEQKRFNKELQSKPLLIDVLKKSSRIKYNLEGYVFLFFPGNYTRAFKFLKQCQL